MDLIENLNEIVLENELCRSQVKQVIEALSERKQWALKMLDSWGGLPSGIFHLNRYTFGNYAECLNVTSEANENDTVIQGRYCMIDFNLNQPISTINEMNNTSGMLWLSSGICVPNSCEAEDIKLIALNILNQTQNQIISNLDIKPENCQNSQLEPFGSLQWIVLGVFIVLILLILAGSICDGFARHRKGQKSSVMLSFSVLRNTKMLFNVSNGNSESMIGCLNGIRCLSMMWIIYGHTHLFNLISSYVNFVDVYEYENKFTADFIFTTELGVDSFLVISGFLTALTMLKMLKRGKINFVIMDLNRLLRLTPLLVAIILFVVAFLKYINPGPLGIRQTLLIETCKHNWWYTLLYIQNYQETEKICLFHTWYLAVDTQLFLLSPIICIPLSKWKKFFWVVFSLLAVPIIYIFTMYMWYNFTMKKLVLAEKYYNNYMEKIHIPTYSRGVSWVIGVLLAARFKELGTSKITKNKIVISLGWLVAILITSTIFFGSRYSSLISSKTTTLESAFWGSLSKVGWSISIAWIIFACHYGFGGYVNSFLSHRIWLPFARLSFCMYVLHPLIQTNFLLLTKTESYFGEYETFFNFCAFLLTTMIFSIIAFLLIESPWICLAKIITTPQRKKPVKVHPEKFIQHNLT